MENKIKTKKELLILIDNLQYELELSRTIRDRALKLAQYLICKELKERKEKEKNDNNV